MIEIILMLFEPSAPKQKNLINKNNSVECDCVH